VARAPEIHERLSGADHSENLRISLHDRLRGRRAGAMTIYRLYLLGPTGRVEAVQRFSAEADKNAVTLGRSCLMSDSWFGGFELWVDNRRIHLEKRRQRNRRLLRTKLRMDRAE
jgi:hypothetical protein